MSQGAPSILTKLDLPAGIWPERRSTLRPLPSLEARSTARRRPPGLTTPPNHRAHSRTSLDQRQANVRAGMFGGIKPVMVDNLSVQPAAMASAMKNAGERLLVAVG